MFEKSMLKMLKDADLITGEEYNKGLEYLAKQEINQKAS